MLETNLKTRTGFIGDALYEIIDIIRANPTEWMIWAGVYIFEKYCGYPDCLQYDSIPEEKDWEWYDSEAAVLRSYCGMYLKVDGAYWFLSSNGMGENLERGDQMMFWVPAFYSKRRLV